MPKIKKSQRDEVQFFFRSLKIDPNEKKHVDKVVSDEETLQ